MFRLLFKLLFGMVLLSPVLLAVLVVQSLDDQAAIHEQIQLDKKDIRRAKNILAANNPARLRQGDVRKVRLTARDLDITVSYLLQRLTPGSARVFLQTDEITLVASLQVPANLFGRWLNLELAIATGNRTLTIEKLALGHLQIPANIANGLLSLSGNLLTDNRQWQLLQETITDWKISPDEMLLTWQWHDEWETLARQQYHKLAQPESVQHYQHLITLQSRQIRSSFPVILATLLMEAKKRSTTKAWQQEYKAVFQALGGWALGERSIKRQGKTIGTLPDFNLRLQGRRDLAQHYLVSAAIAAGSNDSFSHLVGLLKEIDDSNGGSGFSFADLAADRAGTRLAKLVISNSETAEKLLQRIVNNQRESAFLPSIKPFPEGLSAKTFKQQYGNSKDPRYLAMLKKIDLAISQSAIFSGSTDISL